MKLAIALLACALLTGCSNEDDSAKNARDTATHQAADAAKQAFSNAVIEAFAYKLHMERTHNPERAAQCAQSVVEKYGNLTSPEKIAAFAPVYFDGIKAGGECTASQGKFADDIAVADDPASIKTPTLCFENGRIKRMQAVEQAVRAFIIPICTTEAP